MLRVTGCTTDQSSDYVCILDMQCRIAERVTYCSNSARGLPKEVTLASSSRHLRPSRGRVAARTFCLNSWWPLLAAADNARALWSKRSLS